MALRGLSLFTVAALLTACAASQAAAPAASESTADEAVTFMAPYLNVEAFIDKVHSIYPEENIEIVPYSGDNTTSCIQNMIEAHDQPDICTVTVYNPMTDDMSDQLIELCQARRSMPSHYSFESGSLDTLMRIVDCTSCLTIIPEMAVEYIPSDRRDRLKTLSKGATSRKIAVAVRRTYVKNSIIRALTETILANVPGAKA